MAMIRIAVAVAPDGTWEAFGADDDDEKKRMENAQCWLIERGGGFPLRTFWIEAYVEPAVPEMRGASNVIEAEVVDF